MLRDAFLSAIPPADRARWENSDLETLLQRILDAGREDCPTIEVAAPMFMTFLGERACQLEPAWLLELPASDLYLACACGTGSSEAIAELERRYFPTIEGIVRAKLTPTLAEEAMQRVREHLFVGEQPRILDYAGRGELGKWLTITAVRAGLRIIRESKRETALDDHELGALVDTSTDIELAHLRTKYQAEFKLAFAEAFAQLEPRERNLLRQNVLDGLGVERIAELYAVHKSTVSRWLTHAREQLIKRTKTLLRSQLQVSPEEIESIFRMLAGDLDVTLEGILRATRG
jgi:RNA polymerase sigma-70 factor (ECF subfamily)